MVRRPSGPRQARGGGLSLDQRGVALILVTSVIAILTAVTVDFVYRERVNMRMAASARDELRAYYLARSSFTLSRFLLFFQAQIDKSISAQVSQLTTAMAGFGAAPPAGVNPASNLNLRLWEFIPMDCGVIQSFLSAPAGSAPLAEDMLSPEGLPLASFGVFEGGCHAEIEDEDRKINLNHLVGLQRQTQNALLQLMALTQERRYDFLFEEEDRWGVRLTRAETLGALRDYIDENQVQDTLVMGEKGPELLPSAADEGYYYTRFKPEYEPKNAPFDSLDELFLVAGVGDYFMEAFGDALTVYTGKNARLNATPQNLLDLCMRVILAAENPVEASAVCSNQSTMEAMWGELQLLRISMPWTGIQPGMLRGVMENQGVQVNRHIWEGPSALFGTSSTTFTINAIGQAGEVQKGITAVVRMEGPGLGQLLYWKEN